jgi:hypothetical protein
MSRGQMEGYSRICTQSWGLPSNDERGWLVDRIPRRGLPDSGQEGEAVSLLVQQEALESIVLDYRGRQKRRRVRGEDTLDQRPWSSHKEQSQSYAIILNLQYSTETEVHTVVQYHVVRAQYSLCSLRRPPCARSVR